MDYNSVITNDTFLKLQCDSCKNCLSYFPIFISEEKKNICGRCPYAVSQTNCIKNEVYEALAQFIKFPCRYQNEGCPKNAVPKDMANHEQTCDFREVKCPLRDCSWTGARPHVLLHCQGKHSDIMLKNCEFELDTNKSHIRENLMEHDSVLFIIKQKFYSINKLMEFSICNLDYELNAKVISCEVSFKNDNRGVTVKYCIGAFDQDNMVEVTLDALKDHNNSSVVRGKIDFNNTVSGDPPSVEEKVDKDILVQLKCFYCGGYCLPPIYNHENNSSIQCSDCTEDLSSGKTGFSLAAPAAVSPFKFALNETNNSPSINIFGSSAPNQTINFGSSSFSKPSNQSMNTSNLSKWTRNLNLEKIVNLLNYPCKYEANGCPFISRPFHMSTHLNCCPYSSRTCPLTSASCGWTGTGRDMTAHIVNSHEDMILKSSTITENISSPNFKSTTDTVSKRYIIKFSNHLFCLNYMENSKYYHWYVQMIGSFKKGYMYELEIIDRNKTGRSLLSKHPCIPLTKDNAKNGCSFYKDQVVNFLSDQMITFKVQVYK